MNTAHTARRHLVERAAEMLERDMASSRTHGDGVPTARLPEPERQSGGQVFAVPEIAPQVARPPEPDRIRPMAREAEGRQVEAAPLQPAPVAPGAFDRGVVDAPVLEAPIAEEMAARPVAREAPPKEVTPPAPIIPLTALQAAGLIQPPEGQGRSRSIEEIAMVQHQVLRVIADAPPEEAPRSHVILIGSALPREGRTFIALNLAVSIATSGARSVVLVDADGRASSLTRSLGLEAQPGLCDMIADPGGRAAEFALPTVVDRLSVMPYGMRRTAEGEPPPGATSAAAILRLAAALPNHVIVLDPPPCLSTSDCTALAGAAGQVVLVVDAQRTARDEVEAALDGLDACPVLQLLLNRAQLSSGSSFGAHYETADAQ